MSTESMGIKLSAIFVVVFFATNAFSQSYSVKSGTASERQPQDSAVRRYETPGAQKNGMDSAAGRYRVSSSDCQALLRHEPDVDVAYRPDPESGILQGDLAPGPDLNDRARNFAMGLKIDVSKGLSESTGQPVGAEGFIGVIEVRDGVASLDGEPSLGSHERPGKSHGRPDRK